MAGQRDYPTVSGALLRPFQRAQSNPSQSCRRGRVHCGVEPDLPCPFPRLPVRLRSFDRVERGIHRHLTAVAGPMVQPKAYHDDGVNRGRVVGRRSYIGSVLSVSAGADRLADDLGRIGGNRSGSRHFRWLSFCYGAAPKKWVSSPTVQPAAPIPATPRRKDAAACSRWTTGGTRSALPPCGNCRRLIPYAV